MNKKISDLPAITSVDINADPIPIVDFSDNTQSLSGTTKKITVSQIAAAINIVTPSIYTGTSLEAQHPVGRVA